MFREMRRSSAALTVEECNEILARNHRCILSLNDSSGYPYGVPMTYAILDGNIIIHSATEGQKIDCIKADPRVCLTIVDYDELSVEGVTNYYRSVIVYGKAKIVEDNEAKFSYISRYTDALVGKPFRPCMGAVREGKFPMDIIVIEMEHVTGKASLPDTAPQYVEE